MRKLISFFLIFILMATPGSSFAYRESTKNTESTFIPSISLSDLYAVSGPVDIFYDSEFDYRPMLQSFSDNIIDCIPLFFWALDGDKNRKVYFDLSHPSNRLANYDCFIINSNCDIIGNVSCEYVECTCGEWWYSIDVIVAPKKYQPEQVIYLVWVE